MTLPILLIFYVSKWKNKKKHWKIRIWRHCDVTIGRGKSKVSVDLLCTEMIIVCKFHDPSIIGSRDTVGGSEEPPLPPRQSQIDQKSPVWIGLRLISFRAQSLIEKFSKPLPPKRKYLLDFLGAQGWRSRFHYFHFYCFDFSFQCELPLPQRT